MLKLIPQSVQIIVVCDQLLADGQGCLPRGQRDGSTPEAELEAALIACLRTPALLCRRSHLRVPRRNDIVNVWTCTIWRKHPDLVDIAEADAIVESPETLLP